jgi:sortase A
MTKYYYRKIKLKPFKKWFRVLSLGIFISGLIIVLYVFSPLILWQIYFSPIFASQNITTPIPKNDIVNPATIASLISKASNSITLKDYTNAKNWFPNFHPSQALEKPKVSSYTLSIPKININGALVSTTDMDLGKHLVNYQGTSIPGDFGNAVIFGHSTLPQLYNPKDYKTIFSNAYKLKIGDGIYSVVNGVTYLHKIYNITVVSPNDTSSFTQNYDNSYLTLVTCTPPGTVWKRLVIKARLSKI